MPLLLLLQKGLFLSVESFCLNHDLPACQHDRQVPVIIGFT